MEVLTDTFVFSYLDSTTVCAPARCSSTLMVWFSIKNKHSLALCFPTALESWWKHAVQTRDGSWLPSSGGQGTCVPHSPRSLTIRATRLGKLPSQRHYTAAWNIKSFYEKKPIYLFWSFSLKGRLQICHTFRGYRGAIKEHRLRGSISAHSFSPTTAHCTYQKGAYIFIWSPNQIHQPSPKSHLQITQSTGQQGLQLWSHMTVYMCILWELLHDDLASNHPEISYILNKIPSFRRMTGLCTPLTTETYQG